MIYCEAGFDLQTENCLILVFPRPGCKSLIPMSESRSETQMTGITEAEYNKWLA